MTIPPLIPPIPPPPAETSPSRDTRERILDAAEALFGEFGFGASLRTITNAAGVNLASVNYHFGSKDALMEAVIDRRITPINQARLELLDQYREMYSPGPMPVDNVIRAFIEPVFDVATEDDESGGKFVCLMGRLMAEQSEFFRTRIRQKFSPLVERFIAELSRALPHISEKELYLRFLFMIGVINFTMADAVGAEVVGEVVDITTERQALEEYFVAYLTGGFEAPPAKHDEPSHPKDRP